MTIRLFITGGTIDCINLKSNGTKKTCISKMLKQARITIPIETEKLMLKDSRELTNKDRKLILEKCLGCKEDKIIITHGTFTMSETAKFLGERLKDKSIVLLGSMIPFNNNKSDALFNLGSAIIAVQLLPKGVYITMNGRVFSWNNAKKNLKTGVFEEIKK